MDRQPSAFLSPHLFLAPQTVSKYIVHEEKSAEWNCAPPRPFVAATAVFSGPAVKSGSALRAEVLVSPLRAGIKAIAVGKDGVKPIPPDIVDSITAELELIAEMDASSIGEDDLRLDLFILRASFMGALFVKESLNEAEMRILCLASNDEFAEGRVRSAHGMECSSGEVLAYVTAGINPFEPQSTILRTYAYMLLNGEPLSQDEAEELGKILYLPDGLKQRTVEDRFAWTRQNRKSSLTLEEIEEQVNRLYPFLGKDISAKAEKALIAHVMRIRHETAEEIAGLALAAQSTLSPAFKTAIPVDEGSNGISLAPFVHIAEPFDGTVTWDVLTPLITRHLRETFGFNTVMSTGYSAGPKYGPNLLSVAQALGIPFSRNAAELRENCNNEYGAVVQQSDVSPGLAEWTHPRRVILKRPSIATVEKYVDAVPGGAAVFVGSAFHGNYIEKMAAAAEALAYPAYVIIGKGMEGTTGLGVGPRRVGLFLLGLRNADRTYMKEEIRFGPRDAGVEPSSEEPAKGSASASETAVKIQRFVESGGRSGDPVFDARVATTLAGFDLVFTKIVEHFETEKGK